MLKKAKWRQSFRLITLIAPIIIGLFALLYGQKIFHPRPRLVVQYNINQLQYPENSAGIKDTSWVKVWAMIDKLRLISQEMKMEIVVSEQLRRWGNKHISRLREAGISPQDLIKLWKAKKDGDYDKMLERFSIPQQEKIDNMFNDIFTDLDREIPLQLLSTALARMREMLSEFTTGYRLEYKVRNIGQKEASHVIIKIDPGSTISLAENPHSENIIQRFETINNEIILIELDSLSPTRSVEGLIWCPSIKNKVPISVSFEEGQVDIKESLLSSRVAIWYNIIMPLLAPILIGIIIVLVIVIITYRRQFKKFRTRIKKGESG